MFICIFCIELSIKQGSLGSIISLISGKIHTEKSFSEFCRIKPKLDRIRNYTSPIDLTPEDISLAHKELDFCFL